MVKPILKWLGGKSKLVESIRPFYQNLKFENYYEPFIGSMSFYFGVRDTFQSKMEFNSILSDNNCDLMNMYEDIKNNPAEIIEALYELEELYKEYGYYYIRGRFNGIDKEKTPQERFVGFERSACVIALNKNCFNGVYRVNSKGLFNVPKGSYKEINIYNETHINRIELISKCLQNVELHCTDYKSILSNAEKGDFVYLDPPYYPLKENSFTAYSGVFLQAEYEELFKTFKELDEKGVNVLMSNNNTEYIRETFKDYNFGEVYCHRFINSDPNKRGKIKELLIYNYEI